MANKKISELALAGALSGTEPIEIVQGGVNKQATTQDIANLAIPPSGTSIQQREETGTSYTIQDSDDDWVIYFTNVAGCTVTLPDSIMVDISFTTVRADGAGIIAHIVGGTAVLFTINSEYDIEEVNGAATWAKKTATDFYGWGSLGPSGGGGGHTIQDEGTPLTQRTNLNFVGANVAVTDDAGNNATVVTISGAGTGDVVGPASAVDSAIVLFNTTTGKLIKDSAVAISTDGTAVSNSDSKVMTEKAVVTYVAANGGGLSADETDMLELSYLRSLYYLTNK